MPTGEFMSPGCEQFTGLIINYDVIFYFVGDHDQPAFFVHHHLMTILDWCCGGIKISPGLVNLIAKITVSNNFIA